jgi:hypothetical protein
MHSVSICDQQYFKKNTLKTRFIHKYYILSFAPPWGQNLYPGDHEIDNFGRGLPALHYYHAFSFYQRCAVLEKKKFENWARFGPGKQKSRNLVMLACLKDASYKI